MTFRDLFNYLKSYAGLAAALAAVLALNIVFAVAARSSYQKFSQKNNELSWAAARKADLLQISRDEAKITPIYERLRASFVAGTDLVEFIEYLEGAAREAGGLAEVASVAEADNQSRVFKVSFAGSYPDLLNFLARLENSGYLLKISKIDVSGSANPESGGSSIRADFNLAVSIL